MALGRKTAICGMKTISTTTKSMMNTKGQIGLMASFRGSFAIPQDTYSVMPTGGVMAPTIRYHDGLYERANSELIGHETPLMMILHWADMWASRILETKTGSTEEKGE